MKMPKAFLNAGHLKWIALICMVIDHIGSTLIESGLYVYQSGHSYEFLVQMGNLDYVLRSIGRLAFPIYLYLLIEGFHHTKDIKKYIWRLGLLAIISEIPFDLAIFNQPFYWQTQNIFFQLLIALLLYVWLSQFKGRLIGQLIGIALAFGLIYLVMPDYDYDGLIAAIIFYYAYGNRIVESLAVIPAFAFEYFLPLVFLSPVFIFFYNGKRGKVNQYFHYFAYPGHLIILYFIRLWLFPN